MDLSNYTIEELIVLGHQINDIIYSYEDGYVYICKVRSYGRNWTDKSIKNKHSLQDLMYEYDGENGIVDVYSTNPHLGGVYNYGELMFIQSIEDYNKWEEYETLKYLVKDMKDSIEKWEHRENLPFSGRPLFEPICTRDDLTEYEDKLAQFDMSFVPPRRYDVEESAA